MILFARKKQVDKEQKVMAFVFIKKTENRRRIRKVMRKI